MRIDVAFPINQVCEIENNISSATVEYTLARRTKLLESLHRLRLSVSPACEIAKSSLGLNFRLLYTSRLSALLGAESILCSMIGYVNHLLTLTCCGRC